MQLEYLIFDAAHEAGGHGSFDALASVPAARLPALLAEVEAVLRWAGTAFGVPGAVGEEAEWDYDLQATLEPHTPLALDFDARSGQLRGAPAPAAGRVSLALALGGTPAFCAAFGAAFAEAG